MLLAQRGYAKEWFHDTAFWDHFAPIIFDESRWEEVGNVADGVTRLAQLDLYHSKEKSTPLKRRGLPPIDDIKTPSISKQAPRLADLCCAIGRMSLEFARRGFAVSAVDINARYLKTAQKNAAKEKLNIEFIEKDIRAFKRKSAFDVAVNLYNSFGYFEDAHDDFLFVKNAFHSLKDGGAFIIDVLGKEIAVRDYVDAEWFERAGFIVLTETEPVDSWAGIWNRWITIKDGKRREKVFIQRLYAASELRSLLLSAGFAEVAIYGDWDESPYDNNAKTLIAVGRKAGVL